MIAIYDMIQDVEEITFAGVKQMERSNESRT